MADNSREETNSLEISIAGITTHLALKGVAASIEQRIRGDYDAFCIPLSGNSPMLVIHQEDGDPYIPLTHGDWEMQASRNAEVLKVVSYYERGWYDFARQYGELTLRQNGNPENFLRVLYAWRCLENDALLQHACGVIRGGQGYVFFGRSGSGKTTTARLSSDATILSDDLVIIRWTENDPHGWQVYGVPFRGDMIEAPRINANAPLKGLYALVKDQRHEVALIEKAEAIARLVASVPFVTNDSQSLATVLAISQKIIQHVPVSILHFRKDPGFWSLINES